MSLGDDVRRLCTHSKNMSKRDKTCQVLESQHAKRDKPAKPCPDSPFFSKTCPFPVTTPKPLEPNRYDAIRSCPDSPCISSALSVFSRGHRSASVSIRVHPWLKMSSP